VLNIQFIYYEYDIYIIPFFKLIESNSSSQPSTPRARSSHRSDDSTASKCSDCRHRCDNKTHSDIDNQGDFDDDSAILNEILNEGEGSGSESNGGIMRHSGSLSSGSDSGFYHARGMYDMINSMFLMFTNFYSYFHLHKIYDN
jgi:hypothetical protein